MSTLMQADRDRWLTKINGQLAFLEVAFSALKQADIGEKVLAQMHRAVIAIRGALRNADAPELEAFTCDLEDLLNLLCKGEIWLTSEVRGLLRTCTQALAAAVRAVQEGGSGEREVHFVRDQLFSILLVSAVTVKR